MTFQYTLRAVALASTCLIPLAAYAADDSTKSETPAPEFNNEATVGVRSQSSGSALYGKYNGNPYGGISGTGGFSVNDSDAWNSGGTTYFRAEGNDLSLNSRLFMPDSSFDLKYGQQGSWGIDVYSSGTHFQQSNNFHSLYNPNGTLQGGLTPGSLRPTDAVGQNGFSNYNGTTYAAGSNTALAFTNTTAPNTGATPGQILAATNNLNSIYAVLNQHNLPQSVGLERALVGGSGKWSPVEDWIFTAGLQHEHKDGTKENSFVTNSTTNINYFLEPVDYDTDRYTAAAAYNGGRLQGKLTYTFSKFTDNAAAVSFQNAFNFAPVAGTAANLVSIYSLPPSNDAHQMKGEVAYSLTRATRLNANVGYELMQQGTDYPQAYGGQTSTKYVPGDAHNLSAQNFFGNVALTSREIPRTDLRASYTIDDRENNEARVSVPNIAGGMITADTTASNHVPIANLPISTMTQTAKLDAGYRVLDSTKVSLNYTYTDKQQDYSVTDRNHENNLGARVNSSFAPELNGSLAYNHSVRTASNYLANGAWMASTYTGASNPLNAGMYYLAARTRDEIKTGLNAGITDTTTIGLNGRLFQDNYPTTVYGVTGDNSYSIGPDISFNPSKQLSTHLFYTYEEVYSKLNSVTSTSTTAQRTDWSLRNKDTIHTVGADTDWKVSDTLKLHFLQNLSYGGTAFDEGSFFLGTAATAAANAAYIATPGNSAVSLPTSKTVTASIGMSAEYKLADNITLMGGYSFERSMDTDYLFGQAPGSSSNGPNISSLGGDGNPSYAIHVISAAVRVKW